MNYLHLVFPIFHLPRGRHPLLIFHQQSKFKGVYFKIMLMNVRASYTYTWGGKLQYSKIISTPWTLFRASVYLFLRNVQVYYSHKIVFSKGGYYFRTTLYWQSSKKIKQISLFHSCEVSLLSFEKVVMMVHFHTRHLPAPVYSDHEIWTTTSPFYQEPPCIWIPPSVIKRCVIFIFLVQSYKDWLDFKT